MKTTKQKADSMEARLARIGARIDRLSEEAKGTLDRTGKRFETEFKRIDEHFSASRAQIKQDVAHTRDDFVTAVEDELDVWRGRLEDLSVQKRLGTMELRDRMGPVLERASITMDHVQRALRDLSEDSFEEGFAESIQKSLENLRSEMAEAEEFS